jgi:hypothetical protein
LNHPLLLNNFLQQQQEACFMLIRILLIIFNEKKNCIGLLGDDAASFGPGYFDPIKKI